MGNYKKIGRDTKMLSDTKALVFAALLTALSVAIGWVCKTYLTFGAIRITFENIPILMAGMFLGPIVGAAVGVASDGISCLLSGFGVNPLIMAGAASIGIVSGVLARYIIKRKGFFATAVPVFAAHIVGSMVIKSVGLYTYGYALEILLLRIPLYLFIAAAESYIVYTIGKNRELSSKFEGLGKHQ